jgi:hypothetical protein
MLVEVVVKGPVQGDRGERRGCRRLEQAALLARRIDRYLKFESCRRGRKIALRADRRRKDQATDRNDNCRRRSAGSIDGHTRFHSRLVRLVARGIDYPSKRPVSPAQEVRGKIAAMTGQDDVAWAAWLGN